MNKFLDLIYEILRTVSIMVLCCIGILGISSVCFFLPMLTDVFYDVVNDTLKHHTSILLFGVSMVLFFLFSYFFSLISAMANGLADALDNAENEEQL